MAAARAVNTVEVYLEIGAKRVFACAYQWPGWCRSGRTEEMALEALGSYADRYRIVASRAGVEFDPRPNVELAVRERISGTTTTDFGAPAAVPASDLEPLKPRDAERLAALVKASWRILDNVVSGAPSELTKGPRGGGRDRDAMVAHEWQPSTRTRESSGSWGFARLSPAIQMRSTPCGGRSSGR